MGVAAILTVVIGLIISILAKLFADEIKAWMPKFIEHIIDRATAALPADHRERFAEEWRADIDETPGDISKVCKACGFRIAAWRMFYAREAYSRAFDLTFALMLMTFLAPWIGFIALATKLSRRDAPVFCRNPYVGRHGKPFYIAEHNTKQTPIGQFVEKVSLETLPMIFSVLRGDMAIIGPRARSSEQIRLLVGYAPEASELLSWRPGIVPPSAVLGGGTRVRGSDVECRRQRLAHDIRYMQNRNLKSDLVLLAKLAGLVVRKNR